MGKRLALLLVIAISASAAGVAMSFAKELCLFSEVKGVVLSQGRPVANAEVERVYNWAWKDVTRSDKIKTDQQGRFSFPKAAQSSFLGSLLPHEPVVTQKIFIRHNGAEYKAWMFTKHNYRENGELNGKPITLTCRLESEPAFKGEIFGICAFEE